MPQPKLHWSAYLWPGLPHLWNRGSWAGLALAVGFTVLLNLWLVALLVWTEWLPAEFRTYGGGVIAALWAVSWLEGRADWRRYLAELADADGLSPEQRHEQHYREAQQHYLTGNWISAEQTLLKILKRDARDVEARLLLATLWRRLNRTDDACRELEKLEKLESASSWRAEIAAERSLLTAEPEEPELSEPPQEDPAILKMTPAEESKPAAGLNDSGEQQPVDTTQRLVA